MILLKAEEVIDLLGLEPLPEEGGYFKRSYQTSDQTRNSAPMGTAIYFLLTVDECSAMHRLDSDEVYHFYLGDPLELLFLNPDGTGEVHQLGPLLQADMRPQIVAKKHVWQGSRVVPNGKYGYSLVGTTMSPGFTWDGFELADRQDLLRQYPDFRKEIVARTR